MNEEDKRRVTEKLRKQHEKPCDNCGKMEWGRWWHDLFRVAVCFECVEAHNAYIENHRYNQGCTRYLPLLESDQPLYAFLEMPEEEQWEYLLEEWFPYGYKESIHGKIGQAKLEAEDERD